MRILHASDLHFGRHSEADQVAALGAFIATATLDAIVLSGDLSQRTRRREFRGAAEFVRACEARAPTVVVPGNHDCAWWTDFLGIGARDAMFTRYRELLRPDLEPHVRIPGATIVGMNSAHGIQPFTLTTRLRDLSVVGAVRRRQWTRARALFDAAPAEDLRILVLHHNILPGATSLRWGLAAKARGIDAAVRTGADLICCGHDHEQLVDEAVSGGRRVVVSTAGTLTDRTRGGRPGAWNLIDVDAKRISVEIHEWTGTEFRRAQTAAFARSAR